MRCDICGDVPGWWTGRCYGCVMLVDEVDARLSDLLDQDVSRGRLINAVSEVLKSSRCLAPLDLPEVVPASALLEEC